MKEKLILGITTSKYFCSYFNFLRKFIMPLFMLARCLNKLDTELDVIVKVPQGCDRYDRFFSVFTALFPKYALFLEEFNRDDVRSDVILINPARFADCCALSEFSNWVLATLDIQVSDNYFVLIERTTLPREYKIRGINVSPNIRYIENHGDLAKSIRSFCKERDLEFVNVRCETLSFLQQVQLFANADYVVGQHGAGLTNILWGKPGSTVIEIQASKAGSILPILRDRRTLMNLMKCGNRWSDVLWMNPNSMAMEVETKMNGQGYFSNMTNLFIEEWYMRRCLSYQYFAKQKKIIYKGMPPAACKPSRDKNLLTMGEKGRDGIVTVDVDRLLAFLNTAGGTA